MGGVLDGLEVLLELPGPRRAVELSALVGVQVSKDLEQTVQLNQDRAERIARHEDRYLTTDDCHAQRVVLPRHPERLVDRLRGGPARRCGWPSSRRAAFTG